jgi:stage II sporulation protein D
VRALLLALVLALFRAPLLRAQTVLKVRPQPSVNATTIEVPLEKYVAAVLAGEGSVLRSAEALKALAVAARTFGVYGRGRHAKEGYDLCGTTHCQRLDLAGITPRLEAATAATAGQLLWWAGKPAFAVYSRDCGGVTEDVSAVWPELSATYLRSQTDPYCLRAGVRDWQWRAKAPDLLAALAASQLRAPRTMEQVTISQRTASGRARELTLAGAGERVRISATAFRFALGRALGWDWVPSDRYEVAGLEFRGTGSGHGVGLCQRGADEMGAEGRSYREILAFYYPGTEVGLTGRGIPWTRLSRWRRARAGREGVARTGIADEFAGAARHRNPALSRRGNLSECHWRAGMGGRAHCGGVYRFADGRCAPP